MFPSKPGFANVEQAVLWLLETYPATRGSYNCLCLAYWIHVDGYPMKLKDFFKTTALESICREARKIRQSRPDLSPEAFHADQSPRETQRLFDLVCEVFPDTELVK